MPIYIRLFALRNRGTRALSDDNKFSLFLVGESFTLGEKRSCVRFWGRRSRRRQRSKRLRLESISEESPVRGDNSWRMWDVGTMPGKLGDALGYLVRYAQQSIAILLCPV